jgi:hypothetical protein
MIKLYALKSSDDKLIIVEDRFIVLPQEPESLTLLKNFVEENIDFLSGCSIVKLEEVSNDA